MALRGKRKKLIILSGGILVVGLIVFGVARSLGGPAVGSVQETPPSTAEKTQPYSQPGKFKGKYVSFSYPAHYKPSPAKPTGSYLEVALYSSADLSEKHISVGVLKGSFTDNGDINYRQKNPALYKETTSSLGLEFSKLDGTEDTFFLAHDGLVASISVTSPYKDLGGDALYVASSLKWL